MRLYFVKVNWFVFVMLFLISFLFSYSSMCYAQSGLLSVLFKDTPILEDIEFNGGITFIFQGAHNANGDTLSKVGGDVDDTSYSVDLIAAKTISDFGKVLLCAEILGGKGVQDELKAYSSVNYDGGKNGRVHLTEGWYEHYFKVIPLTLTMGKLDSTVYIDTNAYADDENTQFLGRIFRKSPTIEFGDYAAGIRLALEPSDFIDIEVVAMDANSDWNGLFAEQFFAGQINFKPQLFQRDGNYRLVAWFNGTDHTKWNDASKTSEEGFGVGISIDQQLTDNLGLFFRYGWQDPEVYLNANTFSLEHVASAGIQLSGDIWGRDEDVLGFAYGHIFPSDDYKNSGGFAAKTEGHLELYYNYKVNDYLSLSPDVQVIWRPYGRDATNGNEAITIFGLRGQVDF